MIFVILLSDDQKPALQASRQILTWFWLYYRIGFQWESGIRKFDEGGYDLVITDICMPGLDGNEILDYV